MIFIILSSYINESDNSCLDLIFSPSVILRCFKVGGASPYLKGIILITRILNVGIWKDQNF